VWLPTTVHCNLEALFGWHDEGCCSERADDTQVPVEHCVVEDGGYRISDGSVTVAAPDLLVGWCGYLVRVSQKVAAPAPVPEFSTSPPELAGTWQFVERAALPARAPSHVS